MDKPKQFNSEKEREEYIAKLSSFAMRIMNSKKDKKYLETKTEREIAILSIIAAAPHLCDEDNILELADKEIDYKKYILNRDKRAISKSGGTNLEEQKIGNMVESITGDMFGVPKYNLNTFIHELIHMMGIASVSTNLTPYYVREAIWEKFPHKRWLIMEGVVECMTEKVMSHPRFFEICEERNYTPNPTISGYDLEVGLIGLMNLAFDDDMEKWHALGPEYQSVCFSDEDTRPHRLRVLLELIGPEYTNKRDKFFDDCALNYNSETAMAPIKYDEKLFKYISVIVSKLVPELIESNLDAEAVVRMHNYLSKVESVFTDLEFDKEDLMPSINQLRAYYPLDYSRVNNILEGIPEKQSITLFSGANTEVTSDYPRLKLEAAVLRKHIFDPVVRAKYIEVIRRCREEERLIKYAEYYSAKHGTSLQARTPQEFLKNISIIALACQDWETLLYIENLTDEKGKISKKSALFKQQNEREAEENTKTYFEKMHHSR